MDNLTEKQERVLHYIEQEVERCNYPPSVREIGRALGISSTATVHAYLDILEQKGYISREASRPRAIRLLRISEGNGGKSCIYVPLVGRVTAGKPVLAEENLEGYFPLPRSFAAAGKCFALMVKGDSMRDAGIFDGDYVVVRQQQNAENGEIAAVLLGEEATVKRLFVEKDRYRLQPENPAFAPIYSRDISVLGKVIGLFRHF